MHAAMHSSRWALAVHPQQARCVPAVEAGVAAAARARVLASNDSHARWLPDSAEIALMVTGQLQTHDRATRSLDSRLSALSSALGHGFVHTYISFGLDREADPMPLAHGNAQSSSTLDHTLPSASLLDVLSRWAVAWKLSEMIVDAYSPCAVMSIADGNVCTSNDSVGIYKTQQTGCYFDRGRRCTHCDSRKYWFQFGRLAQAFELLRNFESFRHRRYRWLVRLRSDFKFAPTARQWPSHIEWAGFNESSIYLLGLTGWSRSDEHWVPLDWFAIVPRAFGEAFFSLGYTYLGCQHRELNEQLCSGKTWDWPSPECIMKVHLSVCLGKSAVFIRSPPWSNNTISTRSLSMPKLVSNSTISIMSLPQRSVQLPHTTGCGNRSATLEPSAMLTPGASIPGLLVVSSMPLKYLVRGLTIAETPLHIRQLHSSAHRHLIASCLKLNLPLYVTYDDDSAYSLPAILPSLLIAEEIFDAVPGLKRLLLTGDSPIEEFTALHGSWEPHGGSGKQTHGLQYIKLLVRKVVTIYHALDVVVGKHRPHACRRLIRDVFSNADREVGAGLIIWADEDVTFLKPPDERLLGFVRNFDMAYVPFQAPSHHPRFSRSFNFTGGLSNDIWVLESGFMTFQANSRTRALAAAAVELYEGGLERLARRCATARKLPSVERELKCPQWMASWLYPNDIYVWALLVRIAHFNIDVDGDVCCIEKGFSQGWLPWHTSAQLRPSHTNFTAPFSLDEYVIHEMAGPVSRVTHLGSTATRPTDPSLQIRSLNISAYRTNYQIPGSSHDSKELKGLSSRRWPRMIVSCGCNLRER